MDEFAVSQEDVQAGIIAECVAQGLLLPAQHAYVLATVQHETASTWLPVKEEFWLTEQWRRRNLRYYPYYGRGYVQLTWKDNYEKFGTLLNIPLAENPDLALQPDYARIILVYGFVHGTFTGRKLAEYVNAAGVDFVGARRCINGTDRAAKIADAAELFLRKLQPDPTPAPTPKN